MKTMGGMGTQARNLGRMVATFRFVGQAAPKLSAEGLING